MRSTYDRNETRRGEQVETRYGGGWCWVSQPLYTDRLRKTLGATGKHSKHPWTANGEWRTGSCPLDEKKSHLPLETRTTASSQSTKAQGGPNRTMARGVPSRSSGTLLIGAI